jgi:ABC-type glycerol-3-phosphate transport system permease component
VSPWEIAGRALVYTILTLGAFTMIFPFYWMTIAAFKTDAQIFAVPPLLVPPTPSFDNLIGLFADRPYGRWYLNSVIIVLFRVPGIVLLSSLAGFAFAKYNFRFRGLLFGIVLGSMMIPFQSLLVPLYLFTAKLGLKNTYWPLIIPQLASGFGIFLMKQFMTSLPDELIDAARIDGCSEGRIFWFIALPLARPGVATLVILSFLATWNDFTLPLIVMNKETMYPLSVGLALLKGYSLWNTPWGQLMTAAFLASLPMIVIFLLMQRQFISGLHLGAVKG